MYTLEHLAAERVHRYLATAEQYRRVRRLRALRRARRMERTAEERLIRAWRRADELRARLGSPD
jgi:hypothetical protein